jgi:hypothetical protein
MQELMGEEVHAKFAELKLAQAERCPKALGTLIKASEVQFHHEVTNQFLCRSSERPVPAPRFPWYEVLGAQFSSHQVEFPLAGSHSRQVHLESPHFRRRTGCLR